MICLTMEIQPFGVLLRPEEHKARRIYLLWDVAFHKSGIKYSVSSIERHHYAQNVNMLIGSWCIEHDLELLHDDLDFDQIIN